MGGGVSSQLFYLPVAWSWLSYTTSMGFRSYCEDTRHDVNYWFSSPPQKKQNPLFKCIIDPDPTQDMYVSGCLWVTEDSLPLLILHHACKGPPQAAGAKTWFRPLRLSLSPFPTLILYESLGLFWELSGNLLFVNKTICLLWRILIINLAISLLWITDLIYLVLKTLQQPAL